MRFTQSLVLAGALLVAAPAAAQDNAAAPANAAANTAVDANASNAAAMLLCAVASVFPPLMRARPIASTRRCAEFPTTKAQRYKGKCANLPIATALEG